MTPEEEAREEIDRLLQAASWQVQDYKDLNLGAALGVAIREFHLSRAELITFFLLIGLLSELSKQNQ